MIVIIKIKKNSYASITKESLELLSTTHITTLPSEAVDVVCSLSDTGKIQ